MKLDTISSFRAKPGVRGVSYRFTGYQVIFFCAIVFILILNGVASIYRVSVLKGSLFSAANDGIEYGIGDDFTSAYYEFKRASEILSPIVGTFEGAGGVSKEAQKVITMSEKLAKCMILADAIEVMFKDVIRGDGKANLTELRAKSDELLDELSEIHEIHTSLEIRTLQLLLSQSQMTVLQTLLQKLDAVEMMVAEGRKLMDTLMILLGDEYPHRILVLFQNNHEVRPTGGFIGSLGFIDMNDGVIEKFEVKDVYEYDGQRVGEVSHPEISKVAGASFGIRDANTSIDFAVSARQVKKFLEEARGPGADTVIGVDLDFIAELLKAVGPIYIDQLSMTLDEKNFDIILSYFVEAKSFGVENPKQILNYFMEGLVDAIRAKGNIRMLVDVIGRMASEKHFAMYSDDEDVQDFLREMELDGGVMYASIMDDFFSVVNISIGGNKSDAYIDQNVLHKTYVRSDGSLANEVEIVRRHIWSQADIQYVSDILKNVGVVEPNADVLRILGKDVNQVLMRVYFPYGSTVTSTQGINVGEMQRYDETFTVNTVVGEREVMVSYVVFPVKTDIGSETKIRIAYDLPYRLKFRPLADYRLMLSKQAGVEKMEFEKQMYYEPPLRSYALYPEFIEQNGFESYKSIIRTDRIMSVAVGK